MKSFVTFSCCTQDFHMQHLSYQIPHHGVQAVLSVCSGKCAEISSSWKSEVL